MENMGLNFGFWKGKNVFITGHTGFKGGWLSTWLKKHGANVLGYSLQPPTNPNLFEAANIKEGIDSIIADVRDLENLKSVILSRKPEIIIHMAAQAIVRYSYNNPVETLTTNIVGTLNVLESVRDNDFVRAIVIVTSDKCYENKEWVWGYRETDSLGGYDPYSASKSCSELIAFCYYNSFFNPSDYGKDHHIAIATARAGNVIGGGDWAIDRLIPDCIKALSKNDVIVMRHPNASRPWQFVLEPLYGYLELAQKLYNDGPIYGGAWNFGPDDSNIKPVKWIVEQIIKLWGTPASWKTFGNNQPHETSYLKLDCSKAKSQLNWYPRWNLKESLEKTIEWYKAYYNGEDVLKIMMEQIEKYEKNNSKEGG